MGEGFKETDSGVYEIINWIILKVCLDTAYFIETKSTVNKSKS